MLTIETLTPLIRAQVAAEIEAEASRSSYRDPSEATEAYLDAARIARGQS